METTGGFKDVVTNVDDLRGIYGPPSIGAVRKQIDALDDHCRRFLAASPFCLLATSAAGGTCDVSPRGGPPGFVTVLDDTHLAIPDLPGNRRVDTMSNMVENPNVGLLFLIPRLNETLRVNGRGWIVRDPELIERCQVMGKQRPVVIGVEVQEVFIHCAKAFLRSQLWKPESWPEGSLIPDVACALVDAVQFEGVTPEIVRETLEYDYRTTLY